MWEVRKLLLGVLAELRALQEPRVCVWDWGMAGLPVEARLVKGALRGLDMVEC